MIVKYIIKLLYDNNYYENYVKYAFKDLIILNLNKSINFCNFELIKYFVEYEEIDTYLIEYYNNHPQFLTCFENFDRYYNYIEKPVINNRLDIIEYLHEHKIINLNEILSSLIKSNIENDKLEIVKYLINNNADVNNKNFLINVFKNNNLKIIEHLINNNINLEIYVYDLLNVCNDIKIIEYIINIINKIDYNKLYEISTNVKLSKYLEDNHKINDELLLLKSGNINIINNFINKGLYKLNKNLLIYNSENECIEFFKKYSIDDNYDDFIDECINNGYLKLIIFIKNTKNIQVKNIDKIIYYSKSEDDALYFIENIEEIDKSMKHKFMLNSINKGYLKIIKYLYDKPYVYYNFGIHDYIIETIHNKKLDILKYLLTYYKESYNVCDLLTCAFRVKDFEIIKYIINTYKSLVKKSSKMIYYDVLIFYEDPHRVYYNKSKDDFYTKVLKFLIEKGAKINIDIIEIFCMNENLEWLNYF